MGCRSSRAAPAAPTAPQRFPPLPPLQAATATASQDQAPLLVVVEDQATSIDQKEVVGSTSQGEGCMDSVAETISTKLAGCRHAVAATMVGKMILDIPQEQQHRATMLVTTILMLTDQWLDGGVLVSLHNGLFKSVSVVLALSIVMPQVIAWAFLRQNDMVDVWSLFRVLTFPMLGAAGLTYMWLVGVSEPGPWTNAALFSIAVSPEPILHLYKGWLAGKEVDEAVWTGVAEGLIEAPASAALTLYPAMLLSVRSHSGASWLFTLSSVFSLAMVTMRSTKLHFYGLMDTTSSVEYAKILLLMKFPQVISQVLGIAMFAFLTRPLPEGIDECTKEEFDTEMHKTSSWLIFVVLAKEVGMNFGVLKTVAPGMSASMAALFAATMVVGSPPGFLQALDGARLGHAVQHMLEMLFLAILAFRMASEAHWNVLVYDYPAFALMFLISVPWAFIASVVMRKEVAPEQRVANARSRLKEALLSEDRLMARLLVDVEGVDVDVFFDTALREENADMLNAMSDFGLVDAKSKFDAAEEQRPPRSAVLLVKHVRAVRDYLLHKNEKAHDRRRVQLLVAAGVEAALEASGESSLDLALWESDGPMAQMLLDAGARPRGVHGFLLADGAAVDGHIDTGKGEGGYKWSGACECDGRVFFSPRNAAEVMVLDPSTGALTFIDTGKGQGGYKWLGACACGGRIFFCPDDAAEVMVLDPSTGALTFIDTGKGRGGDKWAAACECGGRVVFCPSTVAEVMVLDPATGALAFIDTGKGNIPEKWSGACECGGRVFFCPRNAQEVMVLDPSTGALTFIDTGKGQGACKWHGACACGGRVFFCPSKAAEVMVLDPSTGALTFIDTGKGEDRYKWRGTCACGGRVFFCPANAVEVMVLDPATGALTFIDAGKGDRAFKWHGACECGGRVFFCPAAAAEVLQLPAAGGIERMGWLRELGLSLPAAAPAR